MSFSKAKLKRFNEIAGNLNHSYQRFTKKKFKNQNRQARTFLLREFGVTNFWVYKKY